MTQEMRIILEHADKIDPTSVNDYIKEGGYQGLEKARRFNPRELIAEVKKSGLRGRGGAGFNTGMKWSFVPDAPQKYVICNLDEGEPGTYKDRIICQKNAHAVLEGMAITALAIGAQKGYIYCRGEYSGVAQLLARSIESAQSAGVLEGFTIEIRMGAGAYVCGEETALIESIEGNRGEPRFKPPFPGVKGLWGAPTVVNNVETLACLPYILSFGSDWFAGIGAPSYPGTKVMTLSGDVKAPTFFEVPTDFNLKDLIYNLGQGIRDGKKLKAVQVGGSSGAFIPAVNISTSIDFDSMNSIGASLGSGAVLVLDETRNIVEVITRIARFFENESCSKCNPCREGTFRMREIIERINRGEGNEEDLEKLLLLGRVMKRTSLCGLGMAAPVPIETTLKHFKDEYLTKMR